MYRMCFSVQRIPIFEWLFARQNFVEISAFTSINGQYTKEIDSTLNDNMIHSKASLQAL